MKRTAAALALFQIGCAAAAYAIGGPALTKRERAALERGRPAAAAQAVPASGLREEIERSYLIEDFPTAERLCREALNGTVSPGERRGIETLRARCLLKLRRPDEAREIFERLLASAPDARERASLREALVRTRPLETPPALTGRGPVKQLQVEEAARFSVQVGSFSKEKNARSLVRQLAERHYPAFVDAGGPPLYRVRVGPFDSRDEAARQAVRLKADGYPTKMVG